MNSSRSTEVKVGIGVIVAAIVLVAGVMWLGEFRFSRKYANYTVYFTEVGGLGEGDPVTVSGLEMGKVELIELEARGVRADLLIEEAAVLREDLSVEIRSIGLMGEKYIYISPGTSGAVIPPGTVIDGDYKADIPEIVAGMGDIMDDMKAASQSLRRIVQGMEGESTLGESLAKLNEVSDEILMVLKENRTDIRSTTKNLKSVSQDLSEVVGGKKEDMKKSIDAFSRAAGRLDTLTVSLKDLVRSVEEGEGTLGMLIKEKKLHEQMEATLQSLNDLIADIKAHPERYITIEIF
jgi:phospholipid/cholesterol/gamma-HCH transport system substrate-binding protein